MGEKGTATRGRREERRSVSSGLLGWVGAGGSGRRRVDVQFSGREGMESQGETGGMRPAETLPFPEALTQHGVPVGQSPPARAS